MKANKVGRLDPSYFLKNDIVRLGMIAGRDNCDLGSQFYVTDGIHTSIDFDEGSGIKVISAKHPKDGFLDLRSYEEISSSSHAENPRTMLRDQDVLLSTVGTIGNAAVVQSKDLPANSDRHVAIMRALDTENQVSPEYLSIFLNSSYGKMQSVRETTGNVQPNLFLVKIRDIKVARFDEKFEQSITDCHRRAVSVQTKSGALLKEAEETLLRALGLEGWTPPEPLNYTARASDAFTAGRLDAEHFRPKYNVALAQVASTGIKTAQLTSLIEPLRNGVDLRNFTETGTPYIRVGDIKGGRIEFDTAKRVADSALSVKKSIHLKAGDILFTRKGSFGNAAVVSGNQTDAILSTEIMLLRLNEGAPKEVLPDYLAALFNGYFGKLQAEKWAHGVAFYSVTQDDLYKFEIPLLDKSIQLLIAEKYDDAEQLRIQSFETVESAKHAVEIAIEDGEAAALAYLDKVSGKD